MSTRRVTAALAAAYAYALSTARKLVRTSKAVIAVVRRHVPAWVGALLAVALLIPGPLDELLVLLAIAGFAVFKPAMRADIGRAARVAWTLSG